MKISEMLYGSVQVSAGSVKLPVAGLIAEYRKKYDESGIGSRIAWYIYHLSDGRRMVHFKIPSSSMMKSGISFFYDVVFEFMSLDMANIENSDIHLFSNSSGFVYRSAFALHFFGSKGDRSRPETRQASNSQLIPELRNKYPPIVFMKAPEKTNPGELPISDATVYNALFYLIDNISPAMIADGGIATNMGRVIQSVMSVDRVAMERKKLQNRHRREKRACAADIEKDFGTKETDLSKANGVKAMSKPRTPSATKRMSSTSKPGKVKSTRRAGGKAK